MGAKFYLAYKSKSGNLMYIGFRNNKISQVGGKDLAMEFKSKDEATKWKEAMNVNERYQAVEG